MLKAHRSKSPPADGISSTEPYGSNDVEQMFLDAVESGNLTCASACMEAIGKAPHFLNEALTKAIYAGSVSSVQFLLRSGYALNPEPKFQPLNIAIANRNVEILEVLLELEAHPGLEFAGVLSLDKERRFHKPIKAALRYRFPQAIDLLLEYGAIRGLPTYDQSIRFWGEIALEEELEAVKCVKVLLNHLEHEAIAEMASCILVMISHRCYSIEVCKLLMQNGADINFQGSTWPSENTTKGKSTALYAAATSKSKRAAEFMKFLLQSGADPNIASGNRMAGTRPGARQISKHLGMTWDELCQSTESSRVSVNSMSSSEPVTSYRSAVNVTADTHPASRNLAFRPSELLEPPVSVHSHQEHRPLLEENPSSAKRRRMN
ncbi:MAG: hypothetical protein MMC33_004927 [Icmadophila ericetorum]|nr:hypothetical protein [Icmadophila ericetorum]